MKTINKKVKQKQRGVALVMALIMLLLITVVGVASVKVSSLDTKISGNSMFSLMVFQGAESALGKVASNDDLYNIIAAASNDGVEVNVPESYFNPIETVNGGIQLTSSAEMKFENRVSGSLFSNTPNSTLFEYQIFRTTAVSRLNAASAKAKHSAGTAIQSAAE